MAKRARRLLAVAALVVLGTLGGCGWFANTEAVISLDASSGTVPFTVAFDGTTSEGMGSMIFYHWTFGDGAESYDASGTHTYEHAGAFTISLLVRDGHGETDTATTDVTVGPAMWVTDENLDRVYRLSLQGDVLGSFDLPATQPRGVTLAEVDKRILLVIPCANDGNQRILYIDPLTGAEDHREVAPAQSPRQITYQVVGQPQLWHVDGLSRYIYRLNRDDARTLDSFGQSYFKGTSPIVQNVAFLWVPQGLEWTATSSQAGRLLYLEGETHLLYRIEITLAYDIMSTTQLSIEEEPVEITSEIFPVADIDLYGERLFAIDVDRHRIVELDPATGGLIGTPIYGFPGSAPTGLEIQF
jgi:PKD repeat protein